MSVIVADVLCVPHVAYIYVQTSMVYTQEARASGSDNSNGMLGHEKAGHLTYPFT
jgi:hypothetical protein